MVTKVCNFCGDEFKTYHHEQLCCSRECSSKSRIEDLTGRRFGRLTVLNIGNELHGRITWTCLCDCGNIKDVNACELKAGNVRSCGCLAIETARNLKIKNYGESSFNCLYSFYRRTAEKRDYSFNLTTDQFKELTSGNCVYCGKEPSTIYVHNGSDKVNGRYVYNGIDRVDNTIGYEYDNCVSCCGTCNKMKSTHTKENFISHITKIYENLILK